MTEESVSLTIAEVMVLREWFQVVCYHSNVEKRDKDLVQKLSDFEKKVRKK